MIGRSIYIHKLGPIITAEGSVQKMVDKASLAKLEGLWVKIADGLSPSPNVKSPLDAKFQKLVTLAHAAKINVWGWQVPHCQSVADAKAEAQLAASLIDSFHLDGDIADIEAGVAYFQGGVAEADAYAAELKKLLKPKGKFLAISSHDIPQGQPGFIEIFNQVARQCDYNFPQVYYGTSPSVENRLGRAEKANSHLTVPFVPVGAAWVSSESDGGCVSASSCAERTREFIRLVNERGYEGYSFWHWYGAPLAFWEVLNETP